ncbi:MAG: NUDIX domain-containing protein [Candidatus Aenigmarchaeota archaeon]|nr:NUDIX domain-containing protein [Candidatus Aenigmarchaeota archaeon]
MRNANHETIVYSGKIFEVVQQKRDINGREVIYEIARRSPGMRLLIVKEKTMLITKEYRAELSGYDYRLPGGKVFDTLKEYHETIGSAGDILHHAITAATRECIQETGLVPKKITPYQIAKAGATIEWDLFYFVIDEFEAGKQDLEEGEDITVSWKSFDEVRELCVTNQISEDRTVGVLLRYLEDAKSQ